MGGRGAFSKSGGFTRKEYETVGEVAGVKVIESVDKKRKKDNLPYYSNTPGTSYIKLDSDGHFQQLRIYADDRRPLLDVDYGIDTPLTGDNKEFHAHDWTDGHRGPGRHLTDDEMTRFSKYFI